ncbi:MAG: serine protease, partial [Allgaiera sp.]|nr:serine protease [Allgaiera sp.]
MTALVLGLALLFAQALSAQARGTPEGFADLVAKVSPAVVEPLVAVDPEGQYYPVLAEAVPT